jgi:hypothetical protein
LWGYTAGVSRGIALAACAFAVAVGTAAGATRSAVLRGTVLAAPAAPICMPRVPCMHPAAGVVLAFSRGGVTRARVTTGADGTYLTPWRRGDTASAFFAQRVCSESIRPPCEWKPAR